MVTNVQPKAEKIYIGMDISQETISSIECGKSLPKLSHLIAICNVFNCSMDYMMGFSEIKNISIPANSLNSYQQILIENFNRCDKTGRNSLLILSSVLSNKEIDIEIVDGITIIKNNISN